LFQVHISKALAEHLRRLVRIAAEQGHGDHLLAAYYRAIVRMETDPLEFGEPTYRLPALRLQVRCAAIAPLVIHFGVSEDRPDVYIKWVELLGE
jgi:hypothetical protein